MATIRVALAEDNVPAAPTPNSTSWQGGWPALPSLSSSPPSKRY
jgi:hypothetical protein